MADAKSRIDRRQFLKTTAVVGAGLALPAVSWGRVRGANDDLRVAVAGIRSRGWGHVGSFERLDGVRVVALCDVDQNLLTRQAGEFEKKFGRSVDTVVDYRQLLERDDIDVISIATPNHWHALQAIWAVQAGKDVYVEKPVSHNIWEGRQIVRAARKYQRIVQAGTQARSSLGIAKGYEWIQDGNLGKIRLARGLCYKPRQSIGKVSGPQKVPDHIDYNLWIGPSPMVPLGRKRLHYDWHWDFNTGNGDLGNQGIHQMDLCRWAVREQEIAPRVISVGARVGYDDDGNTPNTQFILHDYDRVPVLFEVRGLPKSKAGQQQWGKSMDRLHGVGIGAIIHCDGGNLVIPNYNKAVAYDSAGKKIEEFTGNSDHFENFVQAVRARHAGMLNGDILEGHLSSALCHTGNVSHQVGRASSVEAIRAAIAEKPAARETLDRMLSHLDANDVDVKTDRLTLGAWLQTDAKNERFVGNDAANRMVSREYREPFVVGATL